MYVFVCAKIRVNPYNNRDKVEFYVQNQRAEFPEAIETRQKHD